MSEDKESRTNNVSNKEAAKIAAAMAVALIVVPTIFALGNNVEDIGGFFAKKLIVGVFSFPVLFLIAKYVVLKPKQKAEITIGATGVTVDKKLSKWSYVGVLVGPLMLGLIFVPEFVDGKSGFNFWLGVVFWIVVIFFSAKNIFNARKR